MNKFSFLRDPLFILALLAGPAFILLLINLSNQSDPGSSWDQGKILIYLQVAFLYPVLEEIVFRGMIQGYLWKTRFGYKCLGELSIPNIITSILFTAMHFIFHTPLWALLVFVPSIIFGFFRDRYTILVPSILLHIMYNASYYAVFQF